MWAVFNAVVDEPQEFLYDIFMVFTDQLDASQFRGSTLYDLSGNISRKIGELHNWKKKFPNI